ncbi:MAG: hypothetical protein KDA81_09695, partial [Planctomycetaceae bacterium]|nr:hypothetical protein [Planctomycetaceae bacterium]
MAGFASRFNDLQLLTGRDASKYAHSLNHFCQLISRCPVHLGSRDNLFVPLRKAQITGNGESRDAVVACHHRYQDTCLLTLSHGLARSGAQRVDHS